MITALGAAYFDIQIKIDSTYSAFVYKNHKAFAQVSRHPVFSVYAEQELPFRRSSFKT